MKTKSFSMETRKISNRAKKKIMLSGAYFRFAELTRQILGQIFMLFLVNKRFEDLFCCYCFDLFILQKLFFRSKNFPKFIFDFKTKKTFTNLNKNIQNKKLKLTAMTKLKAITDILLIRLFARDNGQFFKMKNEPDKCTLKEKRSRARFSIHIHCISKFIQHLIV
jgi:hypothetical protein